ncbi:MAG: hypothetical protein RLZ22_415 [Verrucomicrobiota bacterium]
MIADTASRKACSNSTVPRSSGAVGLLGNHAGNKIATEPALISKIRSKVREKEGFL